MVLTICLYAITGCTLFSPRKPTPAVKAAPLVDLKSYSGLWYEIAYLPTFFQAGCRCSMLYYKPYIKRPGQALTGCIKGRDNHVSIKKSRTYVVRNSGFAKHRIETIWPFRHDYWVLYVDKHYRYALMGTPNHRYLWLVSRQSTIPPTIYHAILGIAAKQGYNLNRLKVSQQNCSQRIREHLIRKLTQ